MYAASVSDKRMADASWLHFNTSLPAVLVGLSQCSQCYLDSRKLMLYTMCNSSMPLRKCR